MLLVVGLCLLLVVCYCVWCGCCRRLFVWCCMYFKSGGCLFGVACGVDSVVNSVGGFIDLLV